MIDSPLTGEKLLSLSEAAQQFPGSRGAARLHPATQTRWILKGARAADGGRVNLEAIRVGSRWLMSAEALARFFASLTRAQTEVPIRTPAIGPARPQTKSYAGWALERKKCRPGPTLSLPYVIGIK